MAASTSNCNCRRAMHSEARHAIGKGNFKLNLKKEGPLALLALALPQALASCESRCCRFRPRHVLRC